MLNPHRIANLSFVFALGILIPSIASAEAARPTGLMCELMSHPERTTIFDAQPDFSWIVPLEHRGSKQTAYQIVVESDGKNNVVWDSGKVESDRSVAVEYKWQAAGLECFLLLEDPDLEREKQAE